jgi:hypothetical protein
VQLQLRQIRVCPELACGNGVLIVKGFDPGSSDDDVSKVDSEVARQVASAEAGMKLNYKHRKLDGEWASQH